MSETFGRVQALVVQGEVDVSRHGLRELAADDILLDDVVRAIEAAVVVEDYPGAWKVLPYWSCSAMLAICPCTCCGASGTTQGRRPCWYGLSARSAAVV